MKNKTKIKVPIPPTPSGKVYKRSPNPDAAPRLFLLGVAPEDRTIASKDGDRIRRTPGSGEIICPYSGYQAPEHEFLHPEDAKHARKVAFARFAASFQSGLGNIVKDFNRKHLNSGLISLEVRHSPRPILEPRAIREDLLRNVECNTCGRPYGVYALGLFCPDCGAPNLSLHFHREARLIRDQINLAEIQEKGEGDELAYRLMGNAHEDVLTAFETVLKTVYCFLIREHLPKEESTKLCAGKAIKNAFQNVDRAREKFLVLGIDPFNDLPTEALEFVKLNVHKRHVIGHNLGVADEHYAEIARGQEPGKTVVLLGEEIIRFADLCGDVVNTLETYLLPGAKLPSTGSK